MSLYSPNMYSGLSCLSFLMYCKLSLSQGANFHAEIHPDGQRVPHTIPMHALHASRMFRSIVTDRVDLLRSRHGHKSGHIVILLNFVYVSDQQREGRKICTSPCLQLAAIAITMHDLSAEMRSTPAGCRFEWW